MNQLYGGEYLQHYLETTWRSGYTTYKNEVIAATAKDLKVSQVLDLGGSVNGIVGQPSLRAKLAEKDIDYAGFDLDIGAFLPETPRSLGIPEERIYPSAKGIVGDIVSLPIKSRSVECVVCADVIEHIDHPEKILSEIKRVLKPDGQAIIIIPSLYKLDAVKFAHIDEKRKSSHVNKLTTEEWVELCHESEFSVDTDRSRPLGIMSGLTYLLWLDEEFVPQRKDVEGETQYSENARLFKHIKSLVAEYDPVIDKRLLSDPPRTLDGIKKALENGDLTTVTKSMIDLLADFVSPDELAQAQKCFDAARFSKE